MKNLLSIAIILAALPVQAAFDWDPFHESLTSTNGATFKAWRPFYSTSVDEERWRKDYLWPLYSRKGFKDETYGRLLFFGYHADFSPETTRDRTWVIPFYFQGTSADGENYIALFPIGGSIHEFMGRDELWFVLFPLFSRSRINDVQTTTVLWPIGSRTSGEGIERFRVWPFYGTSMLDGEFEKKFILWPIYTSVEYTNERNPGKGFLLVPIYGRVKTAQASNLWLLPPFFRYAEGERQRSIHAPWPFIQWDDGIRYKRYIWPLWGKKEVGTLTRQFWLWPFIWDSKVDYASYDQNRTRVAPFFHYESKVVKKTTERYEAGDVSSRYCKVWPLMSWERNADRSRFRMLELWPLRNTSGIERNWASYWTLYRREKSPEVVQHHVLWGIYRQTKGNGDLEWSLLKGLAGYRKEANHHSFRILFLRFGDMEERP